MRRAPGIVRFDYGRSHGWLARIMRGGSQRQRLFSDGVHGGSERSLAAAKRWRREQAERMGPTAHGPDLDPRVLGTVVHVPARRGERRGAYRARIQHRGVHYVEQFSCAKYGARRARELAQHTLDLWRETILAGRRLPLTRRSRGRAA